MVKYVTIIRFTDQGVRNLNKSTTRAEAFRQAASKAGVTVDAQYWTAGSFDGVLVFSAQDETTALRCLAALAATGNVRTETVRAFTAKEFEAIAAQK